MREARSPLGLVQRAELRILVVLVLGAMVLRAPRLLWCDTYFNLVLGREIAQSGLIHRNALTHEGYGASVVDLQWLAHFLIYHLERAFGVGGLGLIAASLSAFALLLAARFASERGASPGRVLIVGAAALVTITAQSVMRAQTLSLPFFVVLLWLLAEDARAPGRRVFLLLPITVLWANLHGSALLAPGLGALLIPSRLWQALRERRFPAPGRVLRDVGLVLALAACTLASPYASRLPEYYASTFGNPAFRDYVTEWHAPSLRGSPEAVLILVWVGCLLPSALRCLRPFEFLACLALSGLTLSSARHATPLALAATAFLPPAADRALGRYLRFEATRPLQWLARWLLPAVLVAFFLVTPWLTIRSARAGGRALADRITSARGASRLLSDESHADRLVWFAPELRGKISHDVRIETLPLEFLEALAYAYRAPRSEKARAWLRRYELVVVDRGSHEVLWRALAESPEHRVVFEDPFATLFERTR